MNRKAKIAYAHIVVGFVLFLVGLVTLFNHALNRNENELNLRARTSKKLTLRKLSSTEAGELQLNLSDLLAPSKGKAKPPRAGDYDEDENVDIYTYWYCQLRRQHELGSLHGDEKADGSTSSNRVSSVSSSLLNRFFSFLVCSTDTIYLFMVAFLALLGSLVLLYGCVRFYENDIKPMHKNLDESVSSGEMSETVVKDKTSLRDMILCCLQLRPVQSASSKTTAKLTNAPSPVVYDEIKLNQGAENMIANSFYGPQSVSSTNSIDPQMKLRLAAAERMCPFIYDELPAFILEKKTDLIFDCLTLPSSQYTAAKAKSEPLLRPPEPRFIAPSTPALPKLPLTKPPKLNKAMLDNLVVNDFCANTRTWGGRKTSPRNSNANRDEPKMFSLVIEKENQRRLLESDFDYKSKTVSNLRKNPRTISVQFAGHQECFL